MRILFFTFLLCTALNAKIVFIDVYPGDSIGKQRLQYTVDPQIKTWQLKLAVLGQLGLDVRSYVLARLFYEGYSPLDPESVAGDYGDKPNSTVLFYVLPKKKDVETDTGLPIIKTVPVEKEEEAPKEEEQPKEEKPKEKSEEKAEAKD